MKGGRFIPTALLFFACCGSIAGAPPALEPRKPERKAVYPQVFDLSAGADVNLFNSTSFRTRNARFLNELADSMRALKRDVVLAAGKKSAVLSLWIGTSGAVDSVTVDCDTSGSPGMRDSVRVKSLSWRFTSTARRRFLVKQDIVIGQKRPDNLYRRNRKEFWIGGVVLGLLLVLYSLGTSGRAGSLL